MSELQPSKSAMCVLRNLIGWPVAGHPYILPDATGHFPFPCDLCAEGFFAYISLDVPSCFLAHRFSLLHSPQTEDQSHGQLSCKNVLATPHSLHDVSHLYSSHQANNHAAATLHHSLHNRQQRSLPNLLVLHPDRNLPPQHPLPRRVLHDAAPPTGNPVHGGQQCALSFGEYLHSNHGLYTQCPLGGSVHFSPDTDIDSYHRLHRGK